MSQDPKTDSKNPASAQAMFRASARANEGRSLAYFYGNLGDSIERRLPHGQHGFLGGGNDTFDGAFGPASSWPARGPGNYYGTGLLNGVGRMFSSVNQGNLGGFTYLKNFSTNSQWNHCVIALCTMAYLGYGVVHSIVDLYADFAAEGIEIYHPNKSVQNFYNAWAKKVNLNERIHSMFTNLLISAQAFVNRQWAELSEGDKRAMKKSQSSEIINDKLVLRLKNNDYTVNIKCESILEKLFEGKFNKTLAQQSKEEIKNQDKIPWNYTFLNPIQMEPRGKKIQGEQFWIMALDKKDTLDLAQKMGLNSTNIDISRTEVNLPKKIANQLKRYKGKHNGYYAEIALDKNDLTVVHRPGKFDWFAWGVPFIFPALKSLSFKDCLRNMEAKACETVMNAIYLFKLGNLKEGFPAEDEHFERLADMLQMPSNIGYLLWNDLIEGEVLQPDVQGIFDDKKHQSINRDILIDLGVPEVLLGGKGGNFSNSFIAVASVLEKLESYRNQVKDWLMGELKIIADVMKFQKLPTVKFSRSTLKDEKARHQFMLALYDRNIIAADELLSELETNVDIQTSKKTNEKDLTKIGGLMERKGPYEKPPAGTMPKTPNGRPGGSDTGPTGKQDNPRGPKGQNVAMILKTHDQLKSKARKWLDQIENFCNQKIVQNWSKANPDQSRINYVKQLRKSDRERIEQLIYNVFSHLPPTIDDDHLNDDFIVNILQSDAAINVKASVLEIYTNKIAEYSKVFGKAPTREMRRKFIVSAWSNAAISQIYNI